jgi:hypothetical protein
MEVSAHGGGAGPADVYVVRFGLAAENLAA